MSGLEGLESTQEQRTLKNQNTFWIRLNNFVLCKKQTLLWRVSDGLLWDIIQLLALVSSREMGLLLEVGGPRKSR